MEALEALKDLKVLYVEDEEITREAVGYIIRRKASEVRTAKNGEEGWVIYQTFEPDVVITDLEMPVMNGLEMMRRIRELKKDQPVVILTAFEDEAHMCAGADVVLVKPIEKHRLIEAIVQASGRQSTKS